jgi:hypothetical protein
MRKGLLIALAMGFVSAGAAEAQEKLPDFVNAFAGDWVSYEPSLAAGGQCALVLAKQATGQNFVARASDCRTDLAKVGAWGIVDQQLALLAPDGAVVARLGGNQNRVSGTLASGAEIVFERRQPAERIHQQWASLKCVYEGYSSKCAKDEALVVPQAGAGDAHNLSLLVKLNARVEPRPDAEVAAVLPGETCVRPQECVTTSEGAWCKVKANGKDGWIANRSIRLGKYPIVTFTSGCSLPTN